MKLFISHSSKDAKTAGEICKMLEKTGHKCFLAPRDIRSGHEYAEEIINGIDGSDVIVLLLSKASDSSPHVLREIERAVSKKLPIIVYKLEEVTLSKSMEYFLMTHQWVSEKPKAGYQELLNCVSEFSGESVDNKGQTTEIKKKASKSFIIKSVSISAAAVVILAAAAVLISGTVNRPASVYGESMDINDEKVSEIQENTADNLSVTEPEKSSVTDKVTKSAADSEAEIQSECNTDAENTEITTAQETEAVTEPTEAEKETEPASEQTSETETAFASVNAELGDTVILGEYLGEAIKWRIIGLEDEGRTALVIADNVLTMKCFDAAEGGKYNSYDGVDYWRTAPKDMDKETEKLVRGDNNWETSTLRAWLNSDRDNVEYSGQEPNSQAMSEKKNGYNTESGFLKSFSKEEREAVLTSFVVTNGVTTEDKIFLLSSEELYLLDAADVGTYAVPTDGAAKQDQSRWYELNVNDYSIRDHYWWLRDPDTETGSQVYLVNISYAGDKVISQSAGLEGYGVRPVMRIDLTSDCVEVK